MKGVILAGGTGSRLAPLTEVTNKHLLPVGFRPMIYYPLHKLIEAGITDIMIITGTEHLGSIVTLLGSGHRLGCEFTYRIQDQAGGIAQAIGLTKSFVGDDQFVVILGDNILQDSIADHVRDFEQVQTGSKVLLKEVQDPQRFGVADVQGDKIVSLEEKPAQPKSNYAVIGVYMYDSTAFDYIESLSPSARGELEVTDLNRHYLDRDELRYGVVDGFWSDAGTFPSLRRATELVMEHDYIPFRDLH